MVSFATPMEMLLLLVLIYIKVEWQPWSTMAPALGREIIPPTHLRYC